MVGSLMPDQTKRVVFRLHCPSGAPGQAILLGVSAGGAAPDGGDAVDARPVEAEHLKAALQAGTRGIEALPPRLLYYVPFAVLYRAHTGREDADTQSKILTSDRSISELRLYCAFLSYGSGSGWVERYAFLPGLCS